MRIMQCIYIFKVCQSAFAFHLLFLPVAVFQSFSQRADVAVRSGESLLIGSGTSGNWDRDWKVDGRA